MFFFSEIWEFPFIAPQAHFVVVHTLGFSCVRTPGASRNVTPREQFSLGHERLQTFAVGPSVSNTTRSTQKYMGRDLECTGTYRNYPLENPILMDFPQMTDHAINFSAHATCPSLQQIAKTVLRHLGARESTWGVTRK